MKECTKLAKLMAWTYNDCPLIYNLRWRYLLAKATLKGLMAEIA